MVSVPSIVIGAFVYAILVRPVHHFSGWAGAVALAIIMVPVVLRTTEDMLSLVPWTIREAAFALGAPYYKVIIQVVYRGAATGDPDGHPALHRPGGGRDRSAPVHLLQQHLLPDGHEGPHRVAHGHDLPVCHGPYDDWHRQAWRRRSSSPSLSSCSPSRAGCCSSGGTGSDAAIDLEVRNLNFFYNGTNQALRDISLPIHENRVTALIGPSGCGKTTLLRCFNRMHDLYPRHRYEGEIRFEGRNILSDKEDLINLRSRIGMVFQKPTPFPMTIAENIAYGLRLKGIRNKSELAGRIEQALKHACSGTRCGTS